MFGSHSKEEKECLAIIKDLSESVLNLSRPNRVKLVHIAFFNKNPFIIMAISLPANQSAPINVNLIDSVTLQQVTATFAGTTSTVDNTAVANVDPVLGLIPVSVGSFNLTTTTTATYTNSLGASVTASETVTTPGTITAVVTADAVQLQVTLGTPVPYTPPAASAPATT